MKLAIIGSRNFPRDRFELYMKEHVTPLLDRYFPMQKIGLREGCIVSGGAYGPDTYGRWYAEANHIPVVEYRPDYGLYGNKAPLVRNHTIIEDCDCVLAFWDGQSHGTIHGMNIAKELGKPMSVVRL